MLNKKENISIIGCGWLGLPLAKALVDRGYVVKGSTQTPSKLNLLHQNNIVPFLIEVNKKIKGTNLTQFFNSDLLILNIPPGRKRKDIAKFYPLQIAAVIEKVIQFNIKKVLFISSTSVYGNPNRMVTEADEPLPGTDSGEALVNVETYLAGRTDFETTIVRFGGLVGPNRPAGRFLAGKKGLKNGMAPVNLIHLEDCIEVLIRIIDHNFWGYIFNACSDEHPPRSLFYTHQAEKQGFELPEFEKEDTPSFKIVSSYKLKQTLPYQFIHPDPMKF